MKTFSYCNISMNSPKNKGFLLLELLSALVVLVVMGMMGWSLLARASYYASKTQQLMQATHYAVQAYDQAVRGEPRAMSYQQGPFTINQKFTVQRGLPQYTIQVSWHHEGQKKTIFLG